MPFHRYLNAEQGSLFRAPSVLQFPSLTPALTVALTIALIGALSVALTGCSRNAPDDIPLLHTLQWDLEWSRSIAPSRNRPNQLYIGDMLGSDKWEVLLFTGERLRTYSLGGVLLSSSAPSLNNLIPGVFSDYDGDGKQDLFFGSHTEKGAQIRVYNGLGRSIGGFTESEQADGIGRFIPLRSEGDRLYVLADENWPHAPRGMIAYQLPDFKRQWFFTLPQRPLGFMSFGTSSDPRYVFSMESLESATFLDIGTHSERSRYGDDEICLTVTNRRGTVIKNTPLRKRHNSGRGFIFPARGGFLGVVAGHSEEYSKGYSLYRTDLQGNIKTEQHNNSARLLDVRMVENRYLLVAAQKGRGQELSCYSTGLTRLWKRSMQKPVSLASVGTNPAIPADSSWNSTKNSPIKRVPALIAGRRIIPFHDIKRPVEEENAIVEVPQKIHSAALFVDADTAYAAAASSDTLYLWSASLR